MLLTLELGTSSVSPSTPSTTILVPPAPMAAGSTNSEATASGSSNLAGRLLSKSPCRRTAEAFCCAASGSSARVVTVTSSMPSLSSAVCGPCEGSPAQSAGRQQAIPTGKSADARIGGAGSVVAFTDRLRQTLANGFHAGHEGGGDRPNPGDHHAELAVGWPNRSEEHTSELQAQSNN